MCCHATHHALSRPYNCPIINSPCYFFSGLFLSWRLIRLHVSVLVPFLFPARRGGQRRALVSGECPRRGRYKDTGLLSQYLMHPPLLQNDVRGKKQVMCHTAARCNRFALLARRPGFMASSLRSALPSVSSANTVVTGLVTISHSFALCGQLTSPQRPSCDFALSSSHDCICDLSRICLNSDATIVTVLVTTSHFTESMAFLLSPSLGFDHYL